LDVINEITRLKRVVYFLQRRLSGSATGGGTTVINSGVQSIVEGANITVNDSDPQNPIISSLNPEILYSLTSPTTITVGNLTLGTNITGWTSNEILQAILTGDLPVGRIVLESGDDILTETSDLILTE